MRFGICLANTKAGSRPLSRPPIPTSFRRLEAKPILVITEDSDEQEEVFFGEVPVGAKLRLFGSAHDYPMEGKSRDGATSTGQRHCLRRKLLSDSAHQLSTLVEQFMVRGGRGRSKAGRRLERRRMIAACARWWSMRIAWDTGFDFIRWMDFDLPTDRVGTMVITSVRREAVLARWKAALAAGVNFIATDQYEDLASVMKAVEER